MKSNRAVVAAGQTVYVNATIRNGGFRWVDNVTVGFYADVVSPAQRFATISVSFFALEAVAAATWVASSPGTHSLIAVADDGNLFPEVREDNNQGSTSVSVYASNPPYQPNLRFDAGQVGFPAVPRKNTASSVNITTFNEGQGTVAVAFAVRVKEQPSNTTVANYTIPSLPPQTFRTDAITWTPSLDQEVYLQVTLDWLGQVVEDDEEDNEAQAGVFASPPLPGCYYSYTGDQTEATWGGLIADGCVHDVHGNVFVNGILMIRSNSVLLIHSTRHGQYGLTVVGTLRVQGTPPFTDRPAVAAHLSNATFRFEVYGRAHIDWARVAWTYGWTNVAGQGPFRGGIQVWTTAFTMNNTSVSQGLTHGVWVNAGLQLGRLDANTFRENGILQRSERFRRGSSAGIALSSGSSVTLSGGFARSNLHYGVWSCDATVTLQGLTDTGSAMGARLLNGSFTVTGGEYSNNTAVGLFVHPAGAECAPGGAGAGAGSRSSRSSGGGPTPASPPTPEITSALIADNRLRDDFTSGLGVFITGRTVAVGGSNTVRGHGVGVQVQSSCDATSVHSNTIRSNTYGIRFEGCGAATRAGSNQVLSNSYGIYGLTSSARVEVNTVDGNAPGVVEDSLSASNVNNNTFRRNLNASVSVVAGSTTAVKQNTFDFEAGPSCGVIVKTGSNPFVWNNTFRGFNTCIAVGFFGANGTVKTNFFNRTGGETVYSENAGPTLFIYQNRFVNSIRGLELHASEARVENNTFEAAVLPPGWICNYSPGISDCTQNASIHSPTFYMVQSSVGVVANNTITGGKWGVSVESNRVQPLVIRYNRILKTAFRGISFGYAPVNVTVEHNWINYSRGAAIVHLAAGYARVVDNSVFEVHGQVGGGPVSDWGIDISGGAAQTTVERNIVTEANVTGIHLAVTTGRPVRLNTAEYNAVGIGTKADSEVSNNTVRFNQDGIQVFWSSRSVVRDNVVGPSNTKGLVFIGPRSLYSYTLNRWNRIENNTYGIWLHSTTGCTPTPGLPCLPPNTELEVTLTGDAGTRNNQWGIFINASAPYLQNVPVRNNLLWGVYSVRSSPTLSAGTNLTANANGAYFDGQKVGVSREPTITGSVVLSNTATYGIKVDDLTGGITFNVIGSTLVQGNSKGLATLCCVGLRVSSSTFRQNGFGMDLEQPSSLSVVGPSNNVSKNTVGAHVVLAVAGFNITGNDVWNNTEAGVNVSSNSKATLWGNTITYHPKFGVYGRDNGELDGPKILNNPRIRRNYIGIQLNNSRTLIQGNTLDYQSSLTAIYFYNAPAQAIVGPNNTFFSNFRDVIAGGDVIGGGSARVHNNTHLWVNIAVWGTFAAVDDNTFRRGPGGIQGGMALNVGGSNWVRRNKLQHLGDGMQVWDSVKARSNTVNNTVYGIIAPPGQVPDLEDNEVRDNTYGVVVLSGAATARPRLRQIPGGAPTTGNRIRNNVRGIWIGGWLTGSAGAAPNITDNNTIELNTQYGIYIESDADLNCAGDNVCVRIWWNNIVNNTDGAGTDYGLFAEQPASGYFSARCNWWRSTIGPYDPLPGNPDTNDNPLGERVSNWFYYRDPPSGPLWWLNAPASQDTTCAP